MKTVLFLKSPSTNNASAEDLVGIRDIASHFGWDVRDIDISSKRLAEVVAFWGAIGIIAECGEWKRTIDFRAVGKLPIIYIDQDPALLNKRDFNILNDSEHEGRLAAKELIVTGYRNFAFVPYAGNWWWNEARRRGFVNALELNGFSCRTFESGLSNPNSSAYSHQLRKFVADLPKPCAVFAANDRQAQLVLSEAKALGLAIPGDLAILGADNYLPLCEHASPTISSIKPDLHRAGELAALMLAAVIREGVRYRGSHTRLYGSDGIVRRESTRVFRTPPDSETAAALALIRKDACHGLTAEAVLSSYSCSRCVAAQKFRRVTGRSVLQEIHAVQLNRITDLLANRAIRLGEISDFCGFTNPNSLRKFFLRETGMTMTAWRKKRQSD